MAKDITPRDVFLEQVLQLNLSPEQIAAMLGQFDQEGKSPESLGSAVRHELEVIGVIKKTSNPDTAVR